MFNTRAAVGNFGEVVFAHFFLLLEAEWAVVGGDHLQMVLLESRPELFLVPFFAQWWCKDILRRLKPWLLYVVEREIEVLRASLSIDWQAPVAGLANFFQRIIAAQMYDVHRRTGHLRQRDGARGSLGLGCGR